MFDLRNHLLVTLYDLDQPLLLFECHFAVPIGLVDPSWGVFAGGSIRLI